MQTWISPVELVEKDVTLAPLSQTHETDLRKAVEDGALHQLWYTTIPKPSEVGREIDRRLAAQAAGSMVPFAIMDRTTEQAVGMTTYMNTDAPNRRVEIGSTWMRRSHQRGPWNTQCKFLLLLHAFETLDCLAVELRTHVMNHQSRKAIERLGAKLDGVLRSHMIMPNGTIRDTAVYSILAGEWPTVKAGLEFRLAR
ncbi:MAG: GNAT family protein [Pseudomonadota bacterium]